MVITPRPGGRGISEPPPPSRSLRGGRGVPGSSVTPKVACPRGPAGDTHAAGPEGGEEHSLPTIPPFPKRAGGGLALETSSDINDAPAGHRSTWIWRQTLFPTVENPSLFFSNQSSSFSRGPIDNPRRGHIGDFQQTSPNGSNTRETGGGPNFPTPLHYSSHTIAYRWGVISPLFLPPFDAVHFPRFSHSPLHPAVSQSKTPYQSTPGLLSNCLSRPSIVIKLGGGATGVVAP